MIAAVYIVAFLAALPVAKETVINGQYGVHNSTLTIHSANQCKSVICASNDDTATSIVGITVPYTIICKSARRGGGWTYNSVLASGVHDTYARAYKLIAWNTPAACVPTNLALFVRDANFNPPESLPQTLDMYWIQQLRLGLIAGTSNAYGVYGKRDADLLLYAMLQRTPSVSATDVRVERTGDLFFVTADKQTFQTQHVVMPGVPLSHLDVVKLRALSIPTDPKQHKTLLISIGVTISLLPLSRISAAVGGALILAGAAWCTNDCGKAQAWAFASAGCLWACVFLKTFFGNKPRVHNIMLLAANIMMVALSKMIESPPPGNWTPPLLLVQIFTGVAASNALRCIINIRRTVE